MAERFGLVGAAHLLLIDGERVLLSLRQNTGYADGQWSVVAGHLDGDESIVAAMVREAREEAGLVIAPGDLTIVGMIHARAENPSDREYCHFFLAARRWSGVPTNLEPAKCGGLAWFPLAAPPPQTVPYIRRALENFRRGVAFDSLGWEG